MNNFINPLPDGAKFCTIDNVFAVLDANTASLNPATIKALKGWLTALRSVPTAVAAFGGDAPDLLRAKTDLLNATPSLTALDDFFTQCVIAVCDSSDARVPKWVRVD